MADDRTLSGHAAFITGGGGGIGSGSAAWLARDGAAVVIMGRTEATLVNAKERIAADAGPDAVVEYVVGDALDAADVQAGLDAAAGLGRLTMALSVVGGGTMKPLLMFEPDELLHDLNRNIVSAFLVVKHATPLMTAAGGGSIVLISSDAAKIPWPFLATYNASKGGVEGLVRGAAVELAPLNIRVNAVRPGLVKTETTKDGLFANKAVIEQFLAEKPLGRTGVPDDIAAGVRYLLGPESSWVTGQSLGIEGGNELTRAPVLESLVRKRFGDDAVDAALAGRIPHEVGDLPKR
jgi:NAD(P)-dependent dehydrogenase (short-subunit alcohol dehydrogenase family)